MRATQNFPISGMRPLPMFVTAVVWIKKAAALTHKQTGRLDPRLADAIVAAADEILSGAHREHFVVDVYPGRRGDVAQHERERSARESAQTSASGRRAAAIRRSIRTITSTWRSPPTT